MKEEKMTTNYSTEVYNEFVNFGFSETKSEIKTIWSGSFNLKNEIKEYVKKVDNSEIIIREVNKSSDRWEIGEYQIQGTITYRKYQIEPFSIESKTNFNLFKRNKNLKDFYKLSGSYEKLMKLQDFVELLIQLKDVDLMANGNYCSLNFDFHLKEKNQNLLKSVILLINLINKSSKEIAKVK
jgi:hypothetical protein